MASADAGLMMANKNSVRPPAIISQGCLSNSRRQRPDQQTKDAQAGHVGRSGVDLLDVRMMPLNSEPLHQEAIRPVQAAPRHTGILPCVAFKHFAMRLRGRRSAAHEVVRTAANPDSRGDT